MHYYKRNIGDYHKKAGRLSLLQHGVYCMLLDACYDREKFPTLDEAIDWVWASSEEEIAAVKLILKKFFYEEDGVFIQNRTRSSLQEYTGVCASNSINGKKGGRPKGSKNKPKETQSVNIKTQSVILESDSNPSKSESKPNHKPLTTNHKPLKDIASSQEDSQPVAGQLPTNKKDELFNVYESDIELWADTYPNVDVINQLKKMRSWFDANPTKKKTAGGMKRFINNWLSKAQDGR